MVGRDDLSQFREREQENMSEGVIEVGAIYDEIEEIAQRAAEGGLTVVWGVAVAMVDWLKRTASGRDSE